MSNSLGISLVKDQNVELRGLKKIIIGMSFTTYLNFSIQMAFLHFLVNLKGCGWDPDVDDSPFQFDLDVACFLLDENRKMRSRDNFIYFGNLRFGDSVTHVGDNLTGIS